MADALREYEALADAMERGTRGQGLATDRELLAKGAEAIRDLLTAGSTAMPSPTPMQPLLSDEEAAKHPIPYAYLQTVAGLVEPEFVALLNADVAETVAVADAAMAFVLAVVRKMGLVVEGDPVPQVPDLPPAPATVDPPTPEPPASTTSATSGGPDAAGTDPADRDD